MKHTARSKHRHAILAIAALGLALALPAQVLRYSFDTTYKIGGAEFTPNTGTGGENASKGAAKTNTLDLRMYGLDSANTSIATAAGVAGKGRALDFTGNAPGRINGAVAQIAASPGSFKSLTLTGWFKLASPLQKDISLVRSFQTGSGPESGGIWLLSGGPNNLILSLGDGVKNARFTVHAQALAAQDKWIFVAVSWNGAADLAQWYIGSETAAPAAPIRTVAPASMNMTTTSVKQIALGRGHSKGNGFHGCMDDIRLYDTALDAGQIEEIRAAALSGN